MGETIKPVDEAAAPSGRVARKRTQGGIATSDLVLSACVGANADVFPQILRLHVREGSVIADVTYGKGVFWKNVPDGSYKLLPSNIASGVDCRNLPYESDSIDCVALDPPYMVRMVQKKRGSHGRIGDALGLSTALLE